MSLFLSFKVRLAKSIIKAHYKAGNIFVGLFGNPGSKVAWSCWGLNPGLSDSQSDAMGICHGDPQALK